MEEEQPQVILAILQPDSSAAGGGSAHNRAMGHTVANKSSRFLQHYSIAALMIDELTFCPVGGLRKLTLRDSDRIK